MDLPIVFGLKRCKHPNVCTNISNISFSHEYALNLCTIFWNNDFLYLNFIKTAFLLYIFIFFKHITSGVIHKNWYKYSSYIIMSKEVWKRSVRVIVFKRINKISQKYDTD